MLRLRIVKSNLAKIPEPLGLKATDRGIEWTTEVPKQPRRKTKKEEAAEFLDKALENGPRPSREVEEEANQKGITTMTLRRASEQMGVVKEKNPEDNNWVWRRYEGNASLMPSKFTSDSD